MLTRQSSENTALKLPFLAVSRRSGTQTAPFESPVLARHSIVFTTQEAAGRYLQKRHDNDLEMNLIFRQSLSAYVDGLVAIGFLGVSIDDDQNRRASLADLRSIHDA
jgi:hypothetical protein